ncbi:hypothetical protein SEA_ROSEPHARIE_51 [Streptomyces phage RosePharie]|nr:hypothetical protein SEA_ROSEPHARIE_51 [Streptomyces phage RosePharie]
MKMVNARVIEVGQPRRAYYLGTHVSGTKHYMEIRYAQRQARKWVKADKVELHEGVELRYCEKVSELFS